ncbi:hypothetical protein PF005_g19120 [Phytophthora fragariae]|uniref:Uncharacterized protein n=1 Tax=Phytophthora fragariae TaxID=53985 RepID=A0A6A3X0K6_9STRA|nr:hypothetical protein PF003_g4922 [Phytophthora fragariae]KAE8928837.1 hypothetical protein PF009_g21039 [Phytophthora fragariae]KAE8989609.1 hypothetical protein PF011_g18697 [Phytophthora fragariae]KAE9090603.1 hypothetical protein PF010_g18527 [Phytophthora fragariae]KAE9090691.1 hypothetical protein PF007_g19146 [Phytophthora fragariae]
MSEGPEKFVTGSRTLLNALLLRGDVVPDEMQRVQELVECMDNNAQKIAAAVATNRRRGASATGADTTAQLLKEQKQFISQIVELYEQLSNKPAPASQTTE